MASPPKKNKPSPKASPITKLSADRPNRLRAFGAFVFGLLFLLFSTLTILSHWTERTLTDTKNFSEVVGPLASEETVKIFVSREITDAIVEKASQTDLAFGLLSVPEGTPITPQLGLQLEQKVESSVNRILNSQAFLALWQDGTKHVHAQLIDILASEDQEAIATIDVRPQIDELIALVQDSEFKLGEEIKLESDVGQLKFKSEQLAALRSAYQNFIKLDTISFIAALICGGLAILISNFRLRTLRKLALGLVISTAMAMVIIFIVTNVSLVPGDQTQSDFTATVLGGLLDGLMRLNLYTFGMAFAITLIVSLILHKVSPPLKK